jgi:hypothetical protein
MRTKYSYIFTYRAHFNGDGYAEMSGTATADGVLSEIDLQQLVLDNLPSYPDMPEDVLSEDCVLTRFHYVYLEPVSVPDVSQDKSVSLDKNKRV